MLLFYSHASSMHEKSILKNNEMKKNPKALESAEKYLEVLRIVEIDYWTTVAIQEALD